MLIPLVPRPRPVAAVKTKRCKKHRKVIYSSMEDALLAALAASRTFGKTVRAYHSESCVKGKSVYHITTMTSS